MASVPLQEIVGRRVLEVNTLSPEEQTRIREKSMVVYEKHKAEIGADVVDAVLADLKKIRGQ